MSLAWPAILRREPTVWDEFLESLTTIERQAQGIQDTSEVTVEIYRAQGMKQAIEMLRIAATMEEKENVAYADFQRASGTRPTVRRR